MLCRVLLMSRVRICVQTGRTYLVVSHYVQQCDNIRPSTEVLQDLDLTFYLLLLDRLEHLDDAFLVVDNVDALKHFGVLAAACPTSHLSQHFFVLYSAKSEKQHPPILRTTS